MSLPLMSRIFSVRQLTQQDEQHRHQNNQRQAQQEILERPSHHLFQQSKVLQGLKGLQTQSHGSMYPSGRCRNYSSMKGISTMRIKKCCRFQEQIPPTMQRRRIITRNVWHSGYLDEQAAEEVAAAIGQIKQRIEKQQEIRQYHHEYDSSTDLDKYDTGDSFHTNKEDEIETWQQTLKKLYKEYEELTGETYKE